MNRKGIKILLFVTFPLWGLPVGCGMVLYHTSIIMWELIGDLVDRR